MSSPIKSRYTLEECYSALDIHPKTFRAWLEEDNIVPETSKADKRIKFLSAEQVQLLARLHEKPWPPAARPQEPEVIPVEAYKLLIEQVAEADQQAQKISSAQTSISNQWEAVIHQLADIELAQRQQAEQKSQEYVALYEHWQQTRAALDTAEVVREAEKQETLRQLAQIMEAIKDQDQRMEELTDRLERERATTEQQARRIAELAEHMEQAQASAQEQLTQAEQRLQAQVQVALTTLHREMSEEYERRAQGIETAQARSVATFTSQQEQQATELAEQSVRLKRVTSAVEEAKTAAAASQIRSASTEQDVQILQQLLQAEKSARAALEEKVSQLVKAQEERPAGPPLENQPTPARKKPSRRPKVAERATRPGDLQP